MPRTNGRAVVVLNIDFRSLLEAVEHVGRIDMLDSELTSSYKEDVKKMLDAIDTVKGYQP